MNLELGASGLNWELILFRGGFALLRDILIRIRYTSEYDSPDRHPHARTSSRFAAILSVSV